MNKSRPYSNIGKVMRRLAARNARWDATGAIAKPTAPLNDPYKVKSSSRLARNGKNLAKKGVVRVETWIPDL